MQTSTHWHGQTAHDDDGNPALRLCGWIILAVMMTGLAGRVLDYPLNRDENLFVTVSVMGGFGNLYQQLGYNHLPYLPWLLGTIYRLTETDHYLLVGRVLVLLGWAATVLALLLIARHRKAGFTAFFASAVLLMGNTLLLGPPGMLVSNNLLPVPAAMFAIYFLLRGMSEDAPSRVNCLIAGLFVSAAIGLKANYIFLAPVLGIATMIAPSARAANDRLWGQTLPLALGGLLGGLPILLLILSAPEPFFAHTIRYFTEMQPAYWLHAAEPKVATMAQKVLLAESIWATGTSLLTLSGIAILLALPAVRNGWRGAFVLVRCWPMMLAACLIVCGLLVAFVPTPSFAQYFVPPIPFMIVALLLLRGAMRPDDGKTADGALAALAILALVCSTPRIAPGLLEVTSPARWQSLSLHRDMRALARSAGFSGKPTAMTLTPVLALEGGFDVPPEFAAGQFVYRVAQFLPLRDRRWYTTTSPDQIEAFLESRRPPAIIISGEEALEAPFLAYARAHGYREFAMRRDPGAPRLFRRP